MAETKKIDIDAAITEIQSKFKIIGRSKELRKLILARKTLKHVLIEGEVGIGKTTLARAVSEYFDNQFFRVDGSEDLMPHALVGYFDPPAVIQKGYIEDAYMYGPLAKALVGGDCLFINEINRMPENTQNMLLTALDERVLEIARLKAIHAQNGFWVVATQNPEAHVGVTALGEALKDRFIYVRLDYQPEEEEIEITLARAGLDPGKNSSLARAAVRVVRETRVDPKIQRGASVRAAIDLAMLVEELVVGKPSPFDYYTWLEAAIMALSTKIELEDGITESREEIIAAIVQRALAHISDP